MNHDPGIPEMPPIGNEPRAEEAAAYLLLDEFDSETRLTAAKRKTAFAIHSYMHELASSKALGHIYDHIPEWLGEAVMDKRNVKRFLFIGGSALALIAARKVVGDNWDEKISAGLKSISESIRDKKTTFPLERDLGNLGQSQKSLKLFDELGSHLVIAGDEIPSGTFASGIAIVRNALGKAAFLSNQEPGNQSKD